MARSLLLVLLALTVIAVTAAPLEAPLTPREVCSEIRTRKEWHDLTTKEKKAWIAGVKCMQRTPGIYKNVHDIKHLTAHEDYTYQHKTQSTYVHWNAVFLAWHRYLLWSYETAMREKCDYQGSMPYWDQTLDVEDSRKSDVFNDDHGFGGNGIFVAQPTLPGSNVTDLPAYTGGGCVLTGPFSEEKYVIRTARFDNNTRDDHCLERDFNPRATAVDHTLEAEEKIYKIDKYSEFHYRLEGMPTGPEVFDGIHGAGHSTYAGSRFVDPWSSPSDPVFFMHHANVDRIWHDWQITDRKNRLYQLSYPAYPVTPTLGPDPALNKNITAGLDYPVSVGKLGPDVVINDLMDTRAGFMCFEYARSSKRNPVKEK